jgi:cyclophilin family peptidyl-prolyl cis-trans isomerase
MENDMKATYIVIAILIVALGGLAYFLQGSVEAPNGSTNNYSTSTNTTGTNKPISNGTTTNATTTNSTSTSQTKKFMQATITTNKGVIEIAFGTTTPNTVANFGKLASSKFYDGVRFHRVIKGFMIQAGDPLSKDPLQKNVWGTGGPGYKFNDELTGKETYPQGTLAMANAGPNTNGSQFFIVTASPGAPLPPSYTVFGRVTKGLDVALKIENVQTDSSDRPVEDVIIQTIEVK